MHCTERKERNHDCVPVRITINYSPHIALTPMLFAPPTGRAQRTGSTALLRATSIRLEALLSAVDAHHGLAQ
eukprot:scaffold14896_cov18-Tisochrysis_lutea.AAC.1